MIKVKPYSGAELRKLRKALGKNQGQFWGAINVTQSGGSRYEAGRTIPDQVALLIELVHERRIDLTTPALRKALRQ